jgi:hypothetical protein
MASKENLLKLSAIISRNWSMAIEEDGSYIRIYPWFQNNLLSCKVFHSKWFAMIQE